MKGASMAGKTNLGFNFEERLLYICLFLNKKITLMLSCRTTENQGRLVNRACQQGKL
jgi:hypothetical protein